MRGSVAVLPVASILLAVAGCSRTPTPAEANAPMHCQQQQDVRWMCVEYVEPRSGLARESIFAQCRENGGMLVDQCPGENRVGVCEQTLDDTQPTTFSTTQRVHHYLDPQFASDDEIAAIAGRCSGESVWTDAAELPVDG